MREFCYAPQADRSGSRCAEPVIGRRFSDRWLQPIVLRGSPSGEGARTFVVKAINTGVSEATYMNPHHRRAVSKNSERSLAAAAVRCRSARCAGPTEPSVRSSAVRGRRGSPTSTGCSTAATITAQKRRAALRGRRTCGRAASTAAGRAIAAAAPGRVQRPRPRHPIAPLSASRSSNRALRSIKDFVYGSGAGQFRPGPSHQWGGPHIEPAEGSRRRAKPPAISPRTNRGRSTASRRRAVEARRA